MADHIGADEVGLDAVQQQEGRRRREEGRLDAELHRAGQQQHRRDQQRPEIGHEVQDRHHRAPQHRVGQADPCHRDAGGQAEAEVDDGLRAEEQADLALRLADAAEDQRAHAPPRHRLHGARQQPVLGGEQEIQQDHRRHRRQGERQHLPKQRAPDAQALAGQLRAERVRLRIGFRVRRGRTALARRSGRRRGRRVDGHRTGARHAAEHLAADAVQRIDELTHRVRRAVPPLGGRVGQGRAEQHQHGERCGDHHTGAHRFRDARRAQASHRLGQHQREHRGNHHRQQQGPRGDHQEDDRNAEQAEADPRREPGRRHRPRRRLARGRTRGFVGGGTHGLPAAAFMPAGTSAARSKT